MSYKDKTPQQQQNFRTLLNGLVDMYGDKRHDAHFKMGNFQVSEYGSVIWRTRNAFTKHDCGTSACLLGHGPIFGIINDRALQMRWDEYSQEFFGVDQFVTDGEWDFLFSAEWPDDIQEAIARLRRYIDEEEHIWGYYDFSDRYAS